MTRAVRITATVGAVLLGGVAAYALVSEIPRGVALLLLALEAVILSASLVLLRGLGRAEAPTARQLLQRMSWVTHGIAATVVFVVLLVLQTTRYGVAEAGPATSVDPHTVVVFALWVLGLTLPMAWCEVVVLSVAGGRWIARGAACLVSLFLAGFSLFPVQFRIDPDEGPIDPTVIQTSVVIFVVVLVGYALLLVAGAVLAGARHTEAVPATHHQSAAM
jgi:hypothetical protein